MNFRTYLRQWMLAIGVIFVLVICLTVLIDPYGIWGSPRIKGLNAFKINAPSKVRLTKPAQFERTNARTVVIGNSRPEVGIDPASPCWNPEDRPVYNYAIPGAGISAQLAIAAHAITDDDTQRLLLGIDFVDFLSRRRTANGQELRPEPSEKGDLESLFSALGDRLTSVLSLDALADSLMTAIGQHQQYPVDITESGFNNGNIFAAVVASEGQDMLFDQKLAELEARYQAGAWSFDPMNQETAQVFDSLEEVFQAAGARGVELILFTNPLHADFLDLLRDRGFDDDISAWLKRLNELAQQHGAALWHFATRHEYATEKTPAGSGGTLSHWFWEPSHYRAALGDRLLARIRGTCPGKHAGPLFGLRLHRP